MWLNQLKSPSKYSENEEIEQYDQRGRARQRPACPFFLFINPEPKVEYHWVILKSVILEYESYSEPLQTFAKMLFLNWE